MAILQDKQGIRIRLKSLIFDLGANTLYRRKGAKTQRKAKSFWEGGDLGGSVRLTKEEKEKK